MKSRKKKPRATRLAESPISVATMRSWFKETLRGDDTCPSNEALNKLAELLKVLLHRANNAEEMRQTGSVKNPKDVSPGELFEEKTMAVVAAAADYQDYAGDILQTPNGDVDLELLVQLLRQVLSVRPLPKGPRGHPAKPWKQAARRFASAVQDTLKESGFRRSLSFANPESAPILITTMAIRWAYGSKLAPAGLVTALRGRNRSKSARRSIREQHGK